MSSFADRLKPIVKLVTPGPIRRFAQDYLSRRWDAKYERRSVEEIFSAIYREGKWGTKPDGEFSSGSGSHSPTVVLPYINAVRTFLGSLPFTPSAVDLGCGDFDVGKRLRPHCGRYVACDVVPDLIRSHKHRFASLDVDFRCIDIIEDDLPDGDIVFLRQVLQHLSNSQILRIVKKLYRYKYLVLTEHHPVDPNFLPNRDKAPGGGTRLPRGSGIVLTAAPFLLNAKSESPLCTVSESIAQHPGMVKTTMYELGACDF